MTGEELRNLRRRMGLPIVRFGIEVLGSDGTLNTVSRWVRRLESSDKVPAGVVTKVRAALRKQQREAIR